MRGRLFDRLLLAFVAVILLTVFVLTVSVAGLLHNFFVATRQQELSRDAGRLAAVLAPFIALQRDTASLESSAAAVGRLLEAEVWVLDAQGQFLAYAPLREGELTPEVDLPEIRRVLSGESVTWAGRTERFGRVMLSVGVPIPAPVRPRHQTGAGRVVGAVFLHEPVSGLGATVARVRRPLFLGALLAMAAAAGISIWLSRSLARPLDRMRRTALAIAAGEYGTQVQPGGTEELAELAGALNHMSERLSTTVGQLREEKSRVERVVGSMTDGLVAIDSSAAVTMINPPARLLLGLKDDEGGEGDGGPPSAADPAGPAVTVGARSSGPGGPTGLETLDRLLLQAAREGRTASEVLRSPSGRVVLARVAPVESAADLPAGAVALLQDLTESERLERMRRDFVANVSHELRTPLTAVRGFIEALLDGTVEREEERHRYLEVIREETDRLNGLINELLDLARLEAGKDEHASRPFDLAETAGQVVGRFRPAAAAAGIRLTTTLEEAPPALGDPAYVERVLYNLLDNAVRYTPRAGEVEVRMRPGGEGVEVTVRDTGPGIDPGELPLVWERFYKGDPARQRSSRGTGLGLAIVRQLIELLGGRVFARSRPGEGSVFGFTLPLADSLPPGEDDAPGTAARPATGPATDSTTGGEDAARSHARDTDESSGPE